MNKKNKNGNLVDFKIVDQFEGLEIAEEEQDDFLLMEGVAFHDGVNKNGAYIELADAKKDIGTFCHKPIRMLWDGYNPTGHGYNANTNTFSDKVNNIGYIFDAFVDEGKNEDYKAIVRAVVWKKYYPEISERLVQLHKEGNLKFSIEADRDFEEKENQTRRCYNLNFRGLSIVKNPAWDRTNSLLVAEDENATTDTESTTEGSDTENKAADKETNTSATVENNKPANEATEPKNTNERNISYEQSILDLKEQNLLLKNQIDELTNSARTYQTIVEQYQIEKVGNERLERVTRFIENPKTAEELGKMTSEEFVDYYEKALDDFSDNVAQNNNNSNQIYGLFHKTKEDIDPKQALLDVFKGLS